MTLNTFHYAGLSAKNVTLGVPRLQELINVATTLKTPQLTIYPKNTADHQLLAELLEYRTLKDFVEFTEVLYDPDLYESRVAVRSVLLAC